MWTENSSAALWGEGWHREYFLACTRLMLAAAFTIVGFLDSRFLGTHLESGRLLVLAYLTYSLLSLTVVLFHQRYSLAWRLYLHAAGVLLSSVLIMTTGGAHSPFLLLYFILLVAAAGRWGLKGALLTAAACTFLLLLGSITSAEWRHGAQGFTRGWSSFHGVLGLSVGLILLACFLGMFIGRDTRNLADAIFANRLVRGVLAEPTFRASLEKLLETLRQNFDADQVMLATEEMRGERTFLWQAKRPGDNGGGVTQFFELGDSARQAYFAASPDGIGPLLKLEKPVGNHSRDLTVASNRNGGPKSIFSAMLDRLVGPSVSYDHVTDLRIVSERHVVFAGFSVLLVTSFSFGGRWFGRLTICNPRKGPRQRYSRCLEELVRQVGPVIYKKYLVARLRSQARASERTRLAQDLHDGVIPSLIGAEMRIDVLQRLAQANPSGVVEELRSIQELLRKEIANLRDRMHQVRRPEVEPAEFLNHLADITERFSRDLTISADFVAESDEAPSSRRVCSEMARIVQEALTNVRKHSGAQNVAVRFGRENGHWRLCIEDDGRGFGFTGRLSFAQLEASHEGPLVIKERVRSIGGDLVIESIAGAGARLEILLPRITDGRNSRSSSHPYCR